MYHLNGTPAIICNREGVCCMSAVQCFFTHYIVSITHFGDFNPYDISVFFEDFFEDFFKKYLRSEQLCGSFSEKCASLSLALHTSTNFQNALRDAAHVTTHG